MGTFDDREKGFEQKYKHDKELEFKVSARRNRLLGLWAAKELGLPDAEAEATPRPCHGRPEAGDDDVVEKIVATSRTRVSR
jgi:hypothetical protein